MAGPSPAKTKKKAAINLVALLEPQRLDDSGGQRRTRPSPSKRADVLLNIMFIFCS